MAMMPMTVKSSIKVKPRDDCMGIRGKGAKTKAAATTLTKP